MRLRSKRTIRSHAPFTGTGASLYLNGLFRRLRMWSAGFLAGPESTIGGDNVQKTARVDSATFPTATFTYPNTDILSTTTGFQVRIFKDDVENESNFRAATITLDGDGEDVTSILGRGTLLSTEIRAGGVVRLRFRYDKSLLGVQPSQFLAIRTAGPTSPANSTIAAIAGGRLYEIDTPALSDSAPYTYKIQAKNGSTTLDLLTGIIFTADATGPAAPTSGTVEII